MSRTDYESDEHIPEGKKILESLPKEAINAELSKDEAEKITRNGLAWLGNVLARTAFSESNANSGIVEKELNVAVLEGTKKIAVYLGDWDFSFGKPYYIERPLSHILTGYGFTAFSGRRATLVFRALLQDINADDAWEARIELVVMCFG